MRSRKLLLDKAIIYIFETKTFHCNNCNKEISTWQEVWTKWKFPPKVTAPQLKSIKELEFENAPVICMTCADEIFRKHF